MRQPKLELEHIIEYKHSGVEVIVSFGICCRCRNQTRLPNVLTQGISARDHTAMSDKLANLARRRACLYTYNVTAGTLMAGRCRKVCPAVDCRMAKDRELLAAGKPTTSLAFLPHDDRQAHHRREAGCSHNWRTQVRSTSAAYTFAHFFHFIHTQTYLRMPPKRGGKAPAFPAARWGQAGLQYG